MKKITLLILIILNLNIFAQTYYWVNGSGEWNDSQHWALSSGGESGVTPPGIDNDVVIDENSFTNSFTKTIIINNNAYAKKITALLNDLHINSNNSTLFLQQTLPGNITTYHLNIVYASSNEKTGYTISLSANDETCYGRCDGSITIDFSDSPAPNYPVNLRIRNSSIGYDSTWVVYGDTTISGLCGAGAKYRVTTTDQDGDIQSNSIPVNGPAQITDDVVDIANQSCGNTCDGYIDLQLISTDDPPIVTYQWSNGDADTMAENLCAGHYTVTVTDNNGCQETFGYDITAPTPITVDDSSYTANICDGAGGEIHIDASGGTGTLTYDDGSTSNTTGDFTGLAAGDYTITITDDNGCNITSGIYHLVQNSAIDITTTPHSPQCYNDANGSIDFSISGGTADYDYHWEGPNGYTNDGTTSDNGTISGLVAGTYNLTVTDAVNCQQTTSVTLTEPDSIIANGSQIDVSCNGGNDGSAQVNPTGGTSGYSYNWSTGGTSNSITNLTAGSYSVTITDSHSCTYDTSFTITEPDPIYAHGSQTNVSCNGGNDGSAQVNPTGGTSGYSYSWSTGGTSNSITNLTAGAYSVTITDANSCSKDTSFTITQPTAINISIADSSGPTCYSGTDGYIDISVTGGTPGYSYNWDGPNGFTSSSEDISNLEAGTYNLTVTDNNSCTKIVSYTITEPDEITITENISNISCNGANDGTIDISVTGGTPGYSYNWEGPNGFTSSSEDISNLEAGTYNLTVTDNNSCTKTASYTITEPAPLYANGSQTNVSCNGGNDGSAQVNPTGGTPNYSYSWSNGGTSNSITNLTAGTYQVTISDANSCNKDTSFTITEPIAISVTVDSSSAPTCNHGTNGYIYITVSNGTSPYSYSWTGPNGYTSSNEDITTLEAGTYNLTITDNNGCSVDTSFILNDPDAILITSNVTNISCNGANDGAIDISVSGGTPPYRYDWDTDGTGDFDDPQDLTNLSAGTYSLTVEDNGPCQETRTYTITEPDPIYANGTQTNVDCHSNCNASIDLNPTGGSGNPFTYNWSNGATTEDLNNICAGNYTVTINDGACTKDTSFTITQPDEIIISVADSAGPTCYSGTNGHIDISVTGGVQPYSYSWTGPNGFTSSSEDISNLEAGTYNLTVTDNNSCTKIVSYTITEPDEITITENINNISCNDANDGSIDITVTGGIPAYSYSWDGPNGFTSSSEDISNLEAGTYNLTVTDNNSCTKIVSYTITEPDPIYARGTQINVDCHSNCTASIDLNPTGGSGNPFTYNWSNGATTEDLNNLCAGNYSVTIHDGACTKDTSFTISEPDEIVIAIADSSSPKCNHGSNGYIDIGVIGGTLPYSYSWTGPNGFTSTNEDISNLEAGQYNLTLTDANNCTKTLSVDLTDPEAITLTETHTDLQCNGDNSGSIDLTAQSIYPPTEYTWNGPNGFTSTSEDISGLEAGTYNVTVTDQGPCQESLTVTLTEPAALVITNESHTNITCFGDNDGSITTTVTGGVSPLTFDIGNGSPQVNNWTFNNLSGGTYQVTITDANGCSTTSSNITIVEPDSLQAHFYNINQNICDASCNGSATLSVSGGTVAGGYTYNWNPTPATINNDTSLSDLCPNTYSVTVTDDNNCTDTASLTIIEVIPITITQEQLVNLNCYNDCIGKVEIEASGSHPPLNISWSNGDNDTLIENLCAGTYTVTVSDVNNCSKDTTFTITQPDQIQYSFEISNLTCNGDGDGQVITHVTGGTPDYQFDYGSGFSTDSVNSGLNGGTYQLTITDANNCSVPVGTYTIVEPTAITSSVNLDNAILCNGDCSGQATVTANGGSVATDYQYLWDNGQTTQTATSLCAQQYFVTITDDSSCTHVDSITLIQPEALSVVYDTVHINCSGTCDGSITAHVSGGVAPYSFDWGNGSTPNDSLHENLCAGDYYLTISDANNCQIIDTITIRENNPILITFSNQVNISCNGANDGSVTVNATGGAGGYTYQWSNGQSTQTATNLSPGYVSVTVTDAVNCFVVDSVEITEPEALSYSFEVTNPLCNGDANGEIIIHVTGGTQPYTFDWGSGAMLNDSVHTGLTAGNYSITVVDANSCTFTADTSLTDNPLLTVSITDSTMLSCYDVCIGSATATAVGGTGNYQYNWSNQETTSTINNLCAGTYTLTVNDDNNCTAYTQVTITQPTEISINITHLVRPECNLSTGEITVAGQDGTPGYTYQWGANAGNSTDSAITGLSANTYTVTVTDNNSCQKDTTILLSDSTTMTLQLIDSVATTCSYTCDGSLSVQAQNGIAPYNYVWNNGVNDSAISNQCAGTYIVTVTDAQNCTLIDNFEIGSPDSLIAQVDSVHPISCNGDCNAEIEVSATGGTPNYQFTWSNGDNTGHITDLCSGSYDLTINDANNCQNTLTVNIIEPQELIVNINDSTMVLCYGDNTGSANVHAEGGTVPYSYLWSNGQTDSTATGLSSGWYHVTVSDLGGCSKVDSVFITQGDSLYITVTDVQQPTCGSTCTGSITVAGQGGTPGYSYQWGANAGNSTDSTVNTLCAGVYTVTVSDANNCQLDSSIILNDTSSITVDVIDSTLTQCSYSCDGGIVVQAQNGELPYQYNWSSGSTDSVATDLCIGTYTLTVTDNMNCHKIQDFAIYGPDTLKVLIDSIRPVGCAGECNGEITVSSTGGTPAYSYAWSNGDTISHIIDLCADTFTVIVTDAHNCKDTNTAILNAPQNISLTFNLTPPLCSLGSEDGIIDMEVSGGVPGYAYHWSTGDTIQDISNLDGGDYSVTVVDTVGCSAIDTVTLVPGITVSAFADTNRTICPHDSVQIYGHTLLSDSANYTYRWYPTNNMNDSTSLQPIVLVDSTTIYYFEVIHENGICRGIDSVIISTYPELNVNLGEDQTIIHDQTTQIIATAGDTIATYTWAPDDYVVNEEDSILEVKPDEDITYYVRVVSIHGCSGIDSVMIKVVPELIIPNGITPNGDGINDVWKIDLIERFPNVEVEIYNRWGEQIFYSKGYHASERWDGNYNGKPLPTGTYYYIINLHDEHYKQPFTGPITLVR